MPGKFCRLKVKVEIENEVTMWGELRRKFVKSMNISGLRGCDTNVVS